MLWTAALVNKTGQTRVNSGNRTGLPQSLHETRNEVRPQNRPWVPRHETPEVGVTVAVASPQMFPCRQRRPQGQSQDQLHLGMSKFNRLTIANLCQLFIQAKPTYSYQPRSGRVIYTRVFYKQPFYKQLGSNSGKFKQFLSNCWGWKTLGI